MQVARGLLLCVGLLAVAPANAETSPIQKVVQMLRELQTSNDETMKKVEVEYTRYKQWAEDLIADLGRQIAKNEQVMDAETATDAEGTALGKKMDGEVQQHENDVARWKSDIAAMTDVRGKEKQDFAATLTDYNESVDAISRAIDVLRSHEKSTAQAFLQKVASLKRTPATAKAQIQSYLQQEPATLDDYSAPEAHAYEFQSGGIVDMLKKLQDDFEGERRTLQNDEANAQHAYEQEKQTLDDEIELATQEVGRKSKRGQKAYAEAAAAQAAFKEESNTKAENEKTRADTTTELQTKTEEHNANLKYAEEEKVAVEKAIEILDSPDVTGNPEAGNRLFVQVATMLKDSPDQKSQLVDFLRNAGKKLGSSRLTMLAMKANQNPFGKVIGMIKDLVQKLMDEAREEAEQKGWCDGELAANKVQRDAKTASVDELNERLNEANASIAQLNEDVATLEQEVADMEKAMADRTEQRQAEHATNTKTIADSKRGGEAVAKAMEVLQEFFDNNQPTATGGMKDHHTAGSNVMDFLQVVSSDFNKAVTDTEIMEDDNQEAFEKFIQEGKVSNASKNASAAGKRDNAKQQAKNAEDTKKDIDATQKELDAANAYYEKLKPTCVDDGMSYEERVKAREAEITSLKEALELLK